MQGWGLPSVCCLGSYASFCASRWDEEGAVLLEALYLEVGRPI